MIESLSILLIEDNPADAALLIESLTSHSVRMICASDLAEGLRFAETQRFDAVLLDLNLPDSSGLDTVSRVVECIPETPVIVLTGLEDENLAMRAVALGAQDYLVKGSVGEDAIVRIARHAIERKRTEESLRRERDFAATILDIAGSLVVVLDSDGRIVRFNRACEETTGYSFKEVHGRRLWDFLLLPEDAAAMERNFSGLLSGSYPKQLECHWLTRAGARRLIAWCNSLLCEGNAANLISAGIDITERRYAEDALSEHMRNLERLSDFATRILEPMPYPELFRVIAQQLKETEPHAIIAITEFSAADNRTVVRAIKGPEEKLQRGIGILGRNPVGSSFVFQETSRERMIRGRLARVDKGLFDLCSSQLPEQLCSRLEQELEIGEVFAMPFLFEDDFLGTAAILTDKREGLKSRSIIEAIVNQAGLALKRKRAEDALERAKEELEQRVAERTADLSRAIDSLQTEVEGRILAEQALRDRSNQLRELASELTLAEQRERRRMAKVLHDDLQQLLVGARFQLSPLQRYGDQAVQEAVRTVNELLSKSVEISRTLTSELSPPILYEGGLIPALEWLGRWMLDKHGFRLQLDASGLDVDSAPDEIKVLLFEVVRELLLNVVKHSGVRTAYVAVSRQDGRLQLIVRDEGRGFDPSELSRLGFSGGHGLFGVRERIESYGGAFDIDSRPGHGSCFTMVLPIAEIPEAQMERRGAPRRRQKRTAAAESGEHKIRVLVVDDHAVVRQGLTSLLNNEPDIEIVNEAADGAEALDLSRDLMPDVVLMDINMPGMNGIDATRVIHSEMPGIKVIGLSMFEEAERAAEMRDAGAVSYVAKSAQSSAVAAAIRAAMVQNASH